MSNSFEPRDPNAGHGLSQHSGQNPGQSLKNMFSNVHSSDGNLARTSLLEALLKREQWFVIDLGSAGQVLPLLRDFGGLQHVGLFTDAQAATEVLKRQEQRPEATRVVSIPIQRVAQFLSSIREWGVQAATFNPGPMGVTWYLDDLVVALWGRDSQQAQQASLPLANRDVGVRSTEGDDMRSVA
jgi:hypothetical protein